MSRLGHKSKSFPAVNVDVVVTSNHQLEIVAGIDRDEIDLAAWPGDSPRACYGSIANRHLRFDVIALKKNGPEVALRKKTKARAACEEANRVAGGFFDQIDFAEPTLLLPRRTAVRLWRRFCARFVSSTRRSEGEQGGD